METDTRQLLSRIHQLEERFQKLAADFEEAFNSLLQRQKRQEEEWKSFLKQLESKKATTANGGGSCPVCYCKDREPRSIPCADSGQNNKNNHNDPCGKDVLHLNVGGSKQIAVLRSTLMCLEGSMLATRFSGRWDDSLEKDRDGNFFIDQPADLFMPIIDFLQCKTKETTQHPSISFPSVEEFGGFNRFKKFANIVEFYGMTSVVLPPRIRLLSAKHPDNVRISGHYVDARDHVLCDLVTWPWEPRRIQSFDTTIEVVGTLKVGWVMAMWSFPDSSVQPEISDRDIGTAVPLLTRLASLAKATSFSIRTLLRAEGLSLPLHATIWKLE
jgi:BTB/POZ domain